MINKSVINVPLEQLVPNCQTPKFYVITVHVHTRTVHNYVHNVCVRNLCVCLQSMLELCRASL